MSRNLEARIAKLETLSGIGRGAVEPITIIIRGFRAEGALYGYNSINAYGPVKQELVRTIRKPGESEEKLLDRAEAVARADWLPGSMIVLEELRA